MYKRLITYNIGNDETRGAFLKFLCRSGFEEQPDKSTYAQRNKSPQLFEELKNAITKWSHDKELSEDDSVQIYFPTKMSEKQTFIDMCIMCYDPRAKEIR